MPSLTDLIKATLLSASISAVGITATVQPAYGQEIAKVEEGQERTCERNAHPESFYDQEYISPADISKLETELKRHPTGIGYVRLSDLFFMANQNEEAGKAARKANEIDPKLWKSFLNLGTYHQRRQELNLYIECSKKCVALCPEDPHTHYTLGISYVWAKNYPKAKESFENALRINPDYPPSIRGLKKLSELMSH